jgi:pSer/pThr/pTyr-binding forkhead associated (FHA) protein
MAFQLVVLRGRSSTQTIRLGNDVTIVGRQDGCQLQIRSSQVSRKHCELTEKDGVLIVKDLGSSNGTFINGKKVSGTQRAEHGMELSFGGVKFRVERVGQPAAPVAAKKATDTAVAEAVEVEGAEPILLDDGGESPSPTDSAPTIMQPPSSADETDGDEEVSEDQDVVEQFSGYEDKSTANGLSEDAVADFLFDLDVDEEDKV